MKNLGFIKKFKKKFNNLVDLKNLNAPIIFKDDYLSIKNSLNKNQISTYGRYTQIFENKLKQLTKSKYVIATINGSAAMQVSVIATGIKKNHEVLMPSLNYISNANAVFNCSAIPHFVDVEKENFGACPNKLEEYLKKNCKVTGNKLINKSTNRVIKAIILVYIFGHPPKMNELIKIAKKFKLTVIEDAAEALGSYYKKKHAGTFGEVGTLSFNGNKIITTGGGGAVLTNSKKIAQKVLKLTTLGRKKHPWKFIFETNGYNYRLPSINASLGISQLKKINKLKNNNRILFKQYSNFFNSYNIAKVFADDKDSRSNYWLQAIILEKKNLKLRNEIIKNFLRNKIHVRPIWELVSNQKMFKKCPKMKLNNSNELISRIICLPSRLKF